MARKQSPPRRPRLQVFREFAVDGREWTWRIAVPRRFVLRAVNYYQTYNGAWRAGRKAARECNILLGP